MDETFLTHPVFSCKQALATFLLGVKKPSKILCGCVQTNVRMCECNHVCMQACMCVCAHAGVRLTLCVCAKVCVCVYVCRTVFGSWAGLSSNLRSLHPPSVEDPANPSHKSQSSYLHIVGLLSTLKPNRKEKEVQRSESVTVYS